jgi:hypothetical protein
VAGGFGDTFFRDVLDTSSSAIREFASPFAQELLRSAPITPNAGPDPLGLGTPQGSSFFSIGSGFGLPGLPFTPSSFINPEKVGTGGLALQASRAQGQQGTPAPKLPPGPIARAQQAASDAASSSPDAPLTVDTSSPYYQQAIDAAKAAGIDQPDIFARVVAAESSFDPTKSNPKSGAGGLAGLTPATARELGVDPFNPQQALQGGARYLKQMLDRYGGDYEKALAAYNAGPGTVDKYGGIPPFKETQDYVQRVLNRGQQTQAQSQPQYPQTTPAGEVPPPPPGVKPLRGVTVAQYGSEGLATGAADYICGPVAAKAFVATQGREPTLQEALDMARHLGVIDPKNGMHGIESTVQLIRSLGGQATSGQVEQNRIINEVEHGRPVIINTQGHYFVAEGYDRNTGKFDLGNSAKALRASGGNQWYNLNEIAGLGMGAPRGAIYAGY